MDKYECAYCGDIVLESQVYDWEDGLGQDILVCIHCLAEYAGDDYPDDMEPVL